MFLFIIKLRNGDILDITFKYILCSYLSREDLPERAEDNDLNTSYVLIYQSKFFRLSIRIFKFKYILCSYLSESVKYFQALMFDLNTSYVLIYRWRRGGFSFYSTDLNTSYVLIYQICSKLYNARPVI